MGFPAIQTVPGNKLLILGTETELFAFTGVMHYQADIELKQFVAGETIELKLYTMRQQDGLFYQNGAPITYTGQAAGGGANGEKEHTFPFIAAYGFRVTGKQTGGTAHTILWQVFKV